MEAAAAGSQAPQRVEPESFAWFAGEAVRPALPQQVLNAVPELVHWCHVEAEYKAKAVVAPAYVDLVKSMWRASPMVRLPHTLA